MVPGSPQKPLQMNHEQVESVKHIADIAAAVVAGASLVGLLPSIAALFTIVWTGIRIIETDTGKRIIAWFKRA